MSSTPVSTNETSIRIQQAQAMGKVRDQPAQPFVISEEEVRLNFRNINCRSASGSDNVSGKTLKLCSDSLASVFTQLLQRSFSESKNLEDVYHNPSPKETIP